MILNKILSWNKLSILGISLMLLNNISCIDYEDNVNPNEVTEEMMEVDNLKTGAFFSQMLRRVVIINDGDKLDSDYQIAQNLSHDLYSGYIAATLGSTNHNGQYNFQEQWVNATFDYAYTGIMAPWQSIHKIATEQELPEVDALATIVKVEGMHRIADTFGPIPYVNYGSSSLYDALDLVYNKFFEELDNAIEVLSNYVNGNVDAKLMSDYDCVYGGDVEKWVKFANSLKLRLAIRIANVSPAKAKEMAESAVNHELGLIETNADNATWKYFGTISNPLFVAVRYNEEASGGDTHPAADIICYMNGYNDNRRASYFEESKWPGETYVGLRRGINLSKMKEYFINYSRVKISSSDPVLWMNAAEVAFLRAEATAIYGFNMKGTAADFYEQGVRLSFEQWGATGVDSYLADESSVPALYKDPAGLNTYEKNLSAITVKWNEGASKEEKQERIITQKWIANWPLGNEAWADYRRTGYPKLLPATSEGNLSGGIVDSEKGARRMPYPSEEYTSNTENVQEAVNSYLGGPDNMATDVWWARK